VSVHRWRHAGHTPPVSNVFHCSPQVQNHLSSLRGDQPQSGQRMRGSDGPWLFSCSTPRSKTTDDWARSSESAHMPRYYDPVRMNGMHANFRSPVSTLNSLTLPEQPWRLR
jgi:hypothetical protein